MIIYTNSLAFKEHIQAISDDSIKFQTSLNATDLNSSKTVIVHLDSFGEEVYSWYSETIRPYDIAVVFCTDQPELMQFLKSIQLGISGYCHSYMDIHQYHQLVNTLRSGKNWFPQSIIQQSFNLARFIFTPKVKSRNFYTLSDKELNIAISVSNGLSEQQIANLFKVSEKTVSTNIDRITKKLRLKSKDRLQPYLKRNWASSLL